MMEENIVQNNKTIAEFMGYDLMDRTRNGWEASTFNFHNSWDSLMPVINKVKVFINGTDPLTNKEIMELIKFKKLLNGQFGKHEIEIYNIYKIIVDFIKWYNKTAFKQTEKQIS